MFFKRSGSKFFIAAIFLIFTRIILLVKPHFFGAYAKQKMHHWQNGGRSRSTRGIRLGTPLFIPHFPSQNGQHLLTLHGIFPEMKHPSTKITGYLLGALGAASYGTNPAFAIPLYSDGMDPVSVLFFRYLLAIPVVAAMMAVRGRSFRLRRGDIVPTLSMGVLMALSSLALFVSYGYMGAGIASTLLFLYPIMVAVIMSVFFHEKAGWVTAASIVLALTGVCLITLKPGGGVVSVVGIAWVMVSALSYAIYLVFVNNSRLKSMPPLKLTLYVLLSGAVAFAAIMPAASGICTPRHWYMWANVAGLAILPTAISFYFTTRATTLIGSTPTAILGALEPLTAVALGVVLLGEPLTARIALGFALVISGVSVIVARDSIGAMLVRFRRMLPRKKIIR